MRLDVISDRPSPDPAHLVALYARARAEFCSLGLEPETIDLGTALCEPSLVGLYDANQVFDARVPQGSDAQSLWANATRHFHSRGARCLQCCISPETPAAEREPLETLLRSLGWRAVRKDVMRLDHADVAFSRPEIIVVSARAAMRQYATFAHAVSKGEPQLGEIAIRRLDDPRVDALVAMIDGIVVARACVLSLGEVGLIENVHVLESHRGQKLGRVIMERAIELCARAQFQHVLLGFDAGCPIRTGLYASLGFTKVGEATSWRDPSTFA